MEIKLSIDTWMLLFFVLFLVISLWKISAFFSNKPLDDDDTTQEANEILEQLMLAVIIKHEGTLNEKELCMAMKEESTFDTKRFWRFNENRLRHMLKYYYLKNPKILSITQIYKELQ
jgi:hypothetical protein